MLQKRDPFSLDFVDLTPHSQMDPIPPQEVQVHQEQHLLLHPQRRPARGEGLQRSPGEAEEYAESDRRGSRSCEGRHRRASPQFPRLPVFKLLLQGLLSPILFSEALH